jgi:voltage-gated potassium channel
MIIKIPPKLNYAIVALLSVIAVGTIFYHYFERWEWIDALFFATSTITTVGYGNVVPVTYVGKLFTIAYMIAGIGIALYALSLIGAYYIEQRVEERALHVATRPREHIKKLKCMITPGNEECKPGDKTKAK